MLPLSRTRAALHILLMTSVAAGALAPMSFGAGPSDRWPQWGGLTRDFKSNVTGLADRWPEDGPKRLWSRPLGDGYSSIVADSGRLYTMYREGGEEIVIALSADDGKTIWEHRYRATTYSGQTDAYGQGPNATPLILDDRIVTIGFTDIMHCLDIGSGKPIWSHDLVKDIGGAPLYYGYSGSPMAYKGTIITLVGGEKYGVVALRQSDGSMVWQSKPSDISYAAPVLINVDVPDL